MQENVSKDIIPYDIADAFVNYGNWIMLGIIVIVWFVLGVGSGLGLIDLSSL